MAAISKQQLLHRITRAIDESGWNVIYISSRHPFRLNIYNDYARYLVKIYVWNLSHGGGSKRPRNEYRIQVKVHGSLSDEVGWTTLLLGWWEAAGVFAGFDVKKHSEDLGWSSSIQIKEEALRNAYLNGFATSDKGNQEIAVAFIPEFFVNYVQNVEALHKFGEAIDDLQILEEVAHNPQVNDTDIPIANQARKTTAITVKKKLRDMSFKKRVLTAYSHRCAVCGIQLKLVEAAHIIPVQNEGTDETSNGLALCSLHHRAYDKGFIAVQNDYSTIVSDTYINTLHQSNLAEGLPEFVSNLRPIIHLPPTISDRPNVAYLQQANRLRGFK